MTSIIEASVVDLPEPVGPVTRMRPRGLKRSSLTEGGRPICSSVRSVEGIIRRTQPQRPRSLKTETRKRVPSSCARAKSVPPLLSASATCSGVMISLHSRRVSSAVNASSAIATSSPWMRSSGGMNARTCRSDAPSSIVACSRSRIVISVAIWIPLLSNSPPPLSRRRPSSPAAPPGGRSCPRRPSACRPRATCACPSHGRVRAAPRRAHGRR